MLFFYAPPLLPIVNSHIFSILRRCFQPCRRGRCPHRPKKRYGFVGDSRINVCIPPGRCGHRPLRVVFGYPVGADVPVRPWEVTYSPWFSVKSVFSAGGQSRPPLRNAGRFRTGRPYEISVHLREARRGRVMCSIDPYANLGFFAVRTINHRAEKEPSRSWEGSYFYSPCFGACGAPFAGLFPR